MLKHLVHRLLDNGAPGVAILYASLDTPLYSARSLEILVRLFMEQHQHQPADQYWVLFDEVQCLKDWEVHLKSWWMPIPISASLRTDRPRRPYA